MPPKDYFCGVYEWLEATDPDFAAAVDSLCLRGQLSAQRSGVTFLCPGKSEREKFIKLAGEGDGTKAQELFEAHVIPTFLPRGDSFDSKVGTNARVLLGVKKAESAKVTLDNGAVLQPAKSFSARPRRAQGKSVESKAAVWEVTSGAVPTEGPAFDPASLWGRKTGGAEGLAPSRAAYMAPIESEVFAEFEKGRMGTPEAPLIRGVVGLLSKLKSAGLDQDYLRALCALSRNPACLYILVEPYRPPGAGDYYLSDAAMEAWGGATQFPNENGADVVIKVFEDLRRTVEGAGLAINAEGALGPAAVFANPVGLEASLSEGRQRLLASAGPRSFQDVVTLYQQWNTQNKVGSVFGVWPEQVASAWVEMRKLWQDSFRFWLDTHQHMYHRVGSTAHDLQQDFIAVTRTIFPGRSYGEEVQSYWGGSGIAMNDKIGALAELINSSDFYYFPRSTPHATRDAGGDPEAHPLQRAPWNIDCSSHRFLAEASSRHAASVQRYVSSSV